ncbi:hypothetical protein [Belnapia rosea]|uniref:hypothetical protein n=1 Tax=Belnapia rosea TaxID=938405 RepID=UPI00089090EF|nr:hypothetical protein [Belnapia rosea]SDB74824.1 hypothetical protein SAMN02927895_05526 [Belnapia rosea]
MPPTKPKITPKEGGRRATDRLKSLRLGMAIGRELDDRGITTPAAIGDALGMPPEAAIALLGRKLWREGDVALLEATAARLGVWIPEPASDGWPS